MDDEDYFWHADKHQRFLQVNTIILGVCSQACLRYPRFAISQEKHGDEVDFFNLQITTKALYKLIVLLWVRVVRHAQSIQNNKFAICLQYLKENVVGEVGFFPTDKRQRVLQNDTIILNACGQTCPNHPK